MAERVAAMAMLEKIPGDQRVTIGADKGYDTRDRGRVTASARHSARGTEHEAKRRQRNRCPNDTAQRLRDQSAEKETH